MMTHETGRAATAPDSLLPLGLGGAAFALIQGGR